MSLDVSNTNFMELSRKQIVNNPIVSIHSITIGRVYVNTVHIY